MTNPFHERLGHAFRDPALLQQALTHRSYGARHNERLEFIGDAVLNCVVALALYKRFPDTAADGDPVDPRQHHVQDPEIVGARPRLREPVCPGRRRTGQQTVPGHQIADPLADRDLVLDDEHGAALLHG